MKSIAWSRDGRRLASASEDKIARIWDAGNGQILHELNGHADVVNSVAWSPDGRRLASAGKDRTIRIWDVVSGHSLLELRGHGGAINSIAWNPDGRLASASDDKTIRIWDAVSGQSVLELKGHADNVTIVAWSEDGGRLASASSDKTVRIWDAEDEVSFNATRGVAFRQAKSRFDIVWTRDQADRADRAANPFASAFFHAQLAETEPTNVLNFLLLMEAYREIGDYDGAMNACQRWLRRDPKLAPIYHERSTIRAMRFDADGAWSDLLTAAVLRPHNIAGWPRFAEAAMCRGQHRWAWQWEPYAFEHAHNLAWQQLTNGENAQFEATCRRLRDRLATVEWPIVVSAVLADGLTAAPILSRGCGKLFAEQDLNRRFTSSASAMIHIATIVPDCAGFDPNQLLRVAEMAISPGVDEWWYLEDLGAIHLRAGNPEKATDYLLRAAKQNETTWQRLFLAMAYHRSGKPARAKEWLKKAVEPGQDAPWQHKLIWDRLHKEAQEMLKK